LFVLESLRSEAGEERSSGVDGSVFISDGPYICALFPSTRHKPKKMLKAHNLSNTFEENVVHPLRVSGVIENVLVTIFTDSIQGGLDPRIHSGGPETKRLATRTEGRNNLKNRTSASITNKIALGPRLASDDRQDFPCESSPGGQYPLG